MEIRAHALLLMCIILYRMCIDSSEELLYVLVF